MLPFKGGRVDVVVDVDDVVVDVNDVVPRYG